MRVFAWDAAPSLSSLLSSSHSSNDPRCFHLSRLLAKITSSSSSPLLPSEKQELLRLLSLLLVDPQHTHHIIRLFRPILPDLIGRILANHRGGICVFPALCCSLTSSATPSPLSRVCRCLSLVLPLFPQSLELAVHFLLSSPSLLDTPLLHAIAIDDQMKEKDLPTLPSPLSRHKLSYTCDVLLTCLRFLRFSKDTFIHLWSWSPLLSLLHHSHSLTRSLALECCRFLQRLSSFLMIFPLFQLMVFE